MHHSTREPNGPNGPRDQKAHREPREPNGPEAHRGASRERVTMGATVAHATAFGDGSGFGARVKRVLTPKELVQLQRDIAWLRSLASSRNEFAMKIATHADAKRKTEPGPIVVPARYKDISGPFISKLIDLTGINLEFVRKGTAKYDDAPGVPPVQYKVILMPDAKIKTRSYTPERRKLLRLYFIYMMLIKEKACGVFNDKKSPVVKQLSDDFFSSETLIDFVNQHIVLKTYKGNKTIVDMHIKEGLGLLLKQYASQDITGCSAPANDTAGGEDDANPGEEHHGESDFRTFDEAAQYPGSAIASTHAVHKMSANKARSVTTPFAGRDASIDVLAAAAQVDNANAKRGLAANPIGPLRRKLEVDNAANRPLTRDLSDQMRPLIAAATGGSSRGNNNNSLVKRKKSRNTTYDDAVDAAYAKETHAVTRVHRELDATGMLVALHSGPASSVAHATKEAKKDAVTELALLPPHVVNAAAAAAPVAVELLQSLVPSSVFNTITDVLVEKKGAYQEISGAATTAQAPAPAPAPPAKTGVPAIPAPPAKTAAKTAAKAPAPPSTIAFFKSNKCSRIPDGLLSGSATYNDGMLGVDDAPDLGEYETIIMCDDGGYEPDQMKELLGKLGKWLKEDEDRSLFVVGGKHDDTKVSIPSMQIFNLAQKTRSDITVATVDGILVFMVAMAGTTSSSTCTDIDWSDVYKYVETDGCSVRVVCATGAKTMSGVETRAMSHALHEVPTTAVSCGTGTSDDGHIVFAAVPIADATEQTIYALATRLLERTFRAVVVVVLDAVPENKQIIDVIESGLLAVAEEKNKSPVADLGVFSVSDGHSVIYVMAFDIEDVPWLRADLVGRFTRVLAITEEDDSSLPEPSGVLVVGRGSGPAQNADGLLLAQLLDGTHDDQVLAGTYHQDEFPLAPYKIAVLFEAGFRPDKKEPEEQEAAAKEAAKEAAEKAAKEAAEKAAACYAFLKRGGTLFGVYKRFDKYRSFCNLFKVDAKKESHVPIITHIARQDGAAGRVIFSAVREDQHIGAGGVPRLTKIPLVWTVLSKTALAANETYAEISLMHAKEREFNNGVTVTATVSKPTAYAESIRKAGIQSAVDYISAVYGNIITVANKGKMCSNDAYNMSPLQELVYLTMMRNDIIPSLKDKFIRLYALAPGSGKTRAISLALFDTATRDASKPTCLVLNGTDEYNHLVNEIMRPIVADSGRVGKYDVVQYAMSLNDVANTPGLSTWYDYVYTSKYGLDTKTSFDDSKDPILERTKELLEKKNIYVLTLTEIKSAYAEEPDSAAGKKTRDAFASSINIVADECHELIPYLKHANKCEIMYGFSATPFLGNGSNKKIVADMVRKSQYDFVRDHVCVATGDDVRALLPYATLNYQIIEAPCIEADNRTDRAYYDISISIKKPTIQTKAAAATKETRTPNKYKDHNGALDDAEKKAAVAELLRVLLDGNNGEFKPRSFVYLSDKSMIKTLIDEVTAHNASDADRNLLVVKTTDEYRDSESNDYDMIFIDDGSKDRAGLRDTLNANAFETGYPRIMAFVTTMSVTVEYYAIENTYMVGVPSGPTGKGVCEQARNRAFRMCSHHKPMEKPEENLEKDVAKKRKKRVGGAAKTTVESQPTHTINYILVQRDGIMRGAYALAIAHPQSDENSQTEGALRLDVSTTTVRGDTITGAAVISTAEIDALIKTYSTDGISSTTQTVLTLIATAKSKKDVQLRTHDARVSRLIASLAASMGLINFTVSVNRGPKQHVAFDSEPDPLVSFHDDLFGISFSRIEETVFDGMTHSNGSLVLRFDKPFVASPAAPAPIIDLSASVALTEDMCALGSGNGTIYTNVDTVYYHSAHRIQCMGHARLDCFRVSPRTAGRVFVGTQENYKVFTDMLSGRAIYDGDGGQDCKLTPTMIAIAAKRELLRAQLVTITNVHESKDVAVSAYMNNIERYLKNALGGWSKGNPEFVFADASAAATAPGFKISAGAKSLFVPYAELVQSNTYTGLKQDVRAKGLLRVFANQPDYEASPALAVPEAGARASATIDIRDGTKAYKSMLADITNVRCDTAIFHLAKEQVPGNGYESARVVADTYMIDTEPAKAPKQGAKTGAKKV
jgi:hypothetical protein